MSLRKLVVILVAVCVSTVIATVNILQPFSNQGGETGPTSKEVDNEVPAYAYITSDELVLMRGDRVVARVSRVFDTADPRQNRVAWTHSKNYVAFLSNVTLRQKDWPEEELLFINTHTGFSGHIPCAYCVDVTAIDENSILASTIGNEEGGNLVKYNLDFPTTPGLPVSFSLDGSFLASTQNYILTGAGGLPQEGSDYREKLTLSSTHGYGSSSKTVGYFDSNDYILTAVANTDQRDGEQIAVALNPNPGECVADSPIFILTTDGQMVKTDMSAAEPPDYVPDVQGGVDVNDLWWDSDGHFRATIVSWTCDNTREVEDEKRTLANPSSVWRLDGKKWVKEDAAPATNVRQLDQHTLIVLVIPDCVGPVIQPDIQVYCNTGTLYHDQDEKRIPIAEQVISVSMPPP